MGHRYGLSSKTWIVLGILGLVCLVSVLWDGGIHLEAFQTNRKKNTVYFLTDPGRNGRFGNNLFQYFAAELMKRMYGFDRIESVRTLPPEVNATKLGDAEWIDIMTAYNSKGIVKPLPDGNIVLDGWFQRSDLLTPHREYLRGLFTPENCTPINATHRVCDIANHQPPAHTEYSPQEDMVIHFRLDDFKTHTLGGLFEAAGIKHMLASLKYRKLFIVCDTLRQEWEKAYMSQFADLNPIYVQGSMLDDFVFLKNAKRLVLNASTFAWTAGFLSRATEIHIPQHPNMGPHSHFYLGCFSEGCTPYTNIQLEK